MKYMILVGDGMGDTPIAELGNRTPLEAVATPAMDFVAGRGRLGLLRTVPEGYPPGSDVANLSLLGYRPEECYSGRAPLEAASMGVGLGPDDLAYRCNLVTLEDGGDNRLLMADYSGGHIGSDEARQLILALDRELGREGLRFHPGISYRHLLVHAGVVEGLATVPPHDHTGQDISQYWRDYMASSLAAVMVRAREILADHPVNRARVARGERPANGIWLWGEGRAPAMRTLEARFGLQGALISAVDLLKGIGVCAGMEIINVPGATGYIDTNYEGKAQAALAAIRDKDLVFVHVEAPDEAGHQGSLADKLRAIEDFDQRIVQPILDGMREHPAFRLVVCMDHFTPLAIRTHTAQPVPVAIFDSRQPAPQQGPGYSEANAARAGWLLASGADFFAALLGTEGNR